MSEQESAVPVEIDEGDTRPVNLAAKILVVDDQEANLVATRAALEPLSRAVVTASSGAEALAYLLDHEFALALIDVGMPGMDGYELARMIRARERTQHLPIIFMTSHSHDESSVLRAYAKARPLAAGFLPPASRPHSSETKSHRMRDRTSRGGTWRRDRLYGG
jgi:CheY-like chemotaxis protein